VADELNDFLNPDEIEALLNSAGDPRESSSEPTSTAPPSGSPGTAKATEDREFLDPGDLDALLQPRAVGDATPASHSPETFENPEPGQTLERAQAHLGEAMAGSIRMPDPVAKFGDPLPFSLESFESSPRPAKSKRPLDILQDVELDLRIELGRTEMLIEEVVALKEGSVVTLDKLAGDPVDILVNGRLIARGEVLVLNDNFCVRVAEILTPEG
jgi:flagellar motor switch protein FliN/FliY